MANRSSWGALVVGVSLCLAPVPAWAQPKPDASSDVAQAEARFFSAQKLYADGKFHEALADFRASYELSPSPNSLLYVARCYRELGQFASAYDAYAKVVVESSANKKYAETQKAATEEQAEVSKKVGRLVISMPEGVGAPRVRLGFRNIDSTMYGKELTVEAGKTVVHAEAPGRKPFDWEGNVSPGETHQVAVELPPEVDVAPPKEKPKPEEPSGPQPRQPMRTLAYASAGVGVLGLATWAILGLKASSRYDDLEKLCDGRCSSARQSEVDAGRRETTVSTIGMIVGIAGIGGGVTLWLLSRPGADASAAAPPPKDNPEAPPEEKPKESALAIRVEPDLLAPFGTRAALPLPRVTVGGVF